MNQRERLLAIAIGSVAAVLALWFAWSYVDGQFRTRRTRISGLEKDIREFKLRALQGQKAKSKLAEYEERSLPPDPEVARSLYQHWLLTQVGSAGFTEQEVQAKTAQKEGELYVSQNYDVTGKATLPQVIDLLYAFYSVDYLHRIRLLMLTPIKDSKQMEVHLSIDAVSLADAPVATALHDRPSNRLAKPNKEDYYAAILGRHLFGPPNRAPTLSISGSKEVPVNRPAQLTPKASDPDPLDRVQFRLVESADPQAQLDPTSGRFSWTPRELGKYKFVIEAYDDGYPSKPARQELVLNVIDPPPAAPPPVDTTFRGFDKSKFTVLVGVTDVSGQSEVWLNNRPDGTLLKLRVGDEFEIGSVKGKVETIGLTDFTFVSDGKLRRLAQGEFLHQATVTQQATQQNEQAE